MVSQPTPVQGDGLAADRPLAGFNDGFGRWRWVFDREDLLPTEKFVLLALLLYADINTGHCFPKIATLARKTGYYEKTVRLALKGLKRAGYVVIRRRQAQGRPSEYWLKMPKVPGSAPGNLEGSAEGFRAEHPEFPGSAPGNLEGSAEGFRAEHPEFPGSAPGVSGQSARAELPKGRPNKLQRENINSPSHHGGVYRGETKQSDALPACAPSSPADENFETEILANLSEFASFGADLWKSKSAAVDCYEMHRDRWIRDLEKWRLNREQVRRKVEMTWENYRYGIVHQSAHGQDQATFVAWWLTNWNSVEFERHEPRWASAHRNR